MINKNQNLTIKYNDRGCTLNKALIESQNVWHNVDLLKILHMKRFIIEEKMELTNINKELKSLAKEWTENQFLLQDAWNFKRDETQHRFWTLPGCSCPKLDNNDMIGIGYFIINPSCKIHGVDNE